MDIQHIFNTEDIFTNIFLQSNINIIHNLIFINRITHKYCLDTNLWKDKFRYDQLSCPSKNPLTLIEWLKIYHDEDVKLFTSHPFVRYHYTSRNFIDRDDCNKLAGAIIWKVSSLMTYYHRKSFNIYIKIPQGKQLIFKLLSEVGIPNYHYKQSNLITFHISKNKYTISFSCIN